MAGLDMPTPYKVFLAVFQNAQFIDLSQPYKPTTKSSAMKASTT
jgi:hypothetical protein